MKESTAKDVLRRGRRSLLVFVRKRYLSVAQPCEANDLNRLTGKVVAVSSGMTHHRISLDCRGFNLIALVDRREFFDFSLSAGAEMTMAFSPAAVHVIRDEKD